MAAIIMVICYILFGLGMVFVVGELFIDMLDALSGETPEIMLSYTPILLFIGAAIAKYIAS